MCNVAGNPPPHTSKYEFLYESLYQPDGDWGWCHAEELLGKPVVDHWWQTESGSPMCGMQFDDVKT